MNFFSSSKILTLAVLVLFSFSLITVPVSAQNTVTNTPDNSPTVTNTPSANSSGQGRVFTLTNPLKANSIGAVVLDLVQIFSYVVILIAVLAIIWVGFQYIMASAQGKVEKIKELHEYLLWIVVGIAVVIAARLIVQVVINTLSATGTVNQSALNGAKQALQQP